MVMTPVTISRSQISSVMAPRAPQRMKQLETTALLQLLQLKYQRWAGYNNNVTIQFICSINLSFAKTQTKINIQFPPQLIVDCGTLRDDDIRLLGTFVYIRSQTLIMEPATIQKRKKYNTKLFVLIFLKYWMRRQKKANERGLYVMLFRHEI